MNNTIDVLFATHGAQIGAQVHYDPTIHKWTVWTKQGLERTFNSLTSYVRFMTKG